jgi:hypothetical protein
MKTRIHLIVKKVKGEKYDFYANLSCLPLAGEIMEFHFKNVGGKTYFIVEIRVDHYVRVVKTSPNGLDTIISESEIIVHADEMERFVISSENYAETYLTHQECSGFL